MKTKGQTFTFDKKIWTIVTELNDGEFIIARSNDGNEQLMTVDQLNELGREEDEQYIDIDDTKIW